MSDMIKNDWQLDREARRITRAREALPPIPRSALGIMRQSHAETLSFAARHRRKAVCAGESRAFRIMWARNWLASARKERIARQS